MKYYIGKKLASVLIKFDRYIREAASAISLHMNNVSRFMAYSGDLLKFLTDEHSKPVVP